MHAIIKTGGKQYRVSEGQLLQVEKLPAEPGSTINFDQVLLTSDGNAVKVGNPLLSGATVTAEIVRHGRQPKIRIIKFRRRKHHMKQMGHRQDFTEVRITKIV